ncbi:hypothetical protein V8E54_007715, partial [Elaphomyces granulatus]
SGPPSYDTLARRFSSYPAPVNLFSVRSWQKAKLSNKYVDIHELRDMSELEPKAFDALVSDVNEKTLQTEVSKVFGIDYLVKANGYLYGEGRRAMVPCVIRNGDKAYWVHFLVGNGSPWTFVSENTLDLRLDLPNMVTIAGYAQQVRMSPEISH